MKDIKVMCLKHPEHKMSKSCPEGCIFMCDDAETVKRKLRKAPTTSQGVKNLLELAEYYYDRNNY